MLEQIDYYAIAAVAVDDTSRAETKYWIGKEGDLPWKRQLPTDLAYLHKKLREQATVAILGHKTYESIPEAHFPFNSAIQSIIISQNHYAEVLQKYPHTNQVQAAQNYTSALIMANMSLALHKKKAIAICGGEQLYQAAIEDPNCTKLFLTLVHGQVGDIDHLTLPNPDGKIPEIKKSHHLTGKQITPFTGDRQFPKDFKEYFTQTSTSGLLVENGIHFEFTTWKRTSVPIQI